MGMSEFYGPSDDQQSLATLTRALDLGVNFFDSADTYGLGHNERSAGAVSETRGCGASAGGGCRYQIWHRARSGSSTSGASTTARPMCARHAKHLCSAWGWMRSIFIIAIDAKPDVPIEDTVGAMSDLGPCRQGAADWLVGSIHWLPCSGPHWCTRLRRCKASIRCGRASLKTACWQPVLSWAPRLWLTARWAVRFLTGTVRSDSLAENDFRQFNPRFQGDAEVANQCTW
jgi:hypothetical protein